MLDCYCYINIDIEDTFEILFNQYKGSFLNMVNTIYPIIKNYIYVKRCLGEKIVFSEAIQAVNDLKNVKEFIAKHKNELQQHKSKRGFLRFSLSQPLPQPPPVVKIFPKLFTSLVTILPF